VFKLSADEGNAEGAYFYGIALHYGVCVPKDLVGAAGYFQRATE
jgi:TPR repeat protein